MVGHGPVKKVCVVGRTDFQFGMGRVTLSAIETFALSYEVCLFPTDPSFRRLKTIKTPSGRNVCVCQVIAEDDGVFYCDILWTGDGDRNFELAKKGKIRVAQIVFDSTILPSEWVYILNLNFDYVYVTSKYLVSIAVKSGVNIPIAILPIAITLPEPAPLSLAPKRKLSFLSISSFHSRKSHEIVINAFAAIYENDPDAELVIHSNLAIGDGYMSVKDAITKSGANNISISYVDLTEESKNALIQNSDIFINCSRGEGFSIGAREALALGKTLVISETSAHLDLVNVEGIFMVPALTQIEANYPEIEGRSFGYQFQVNEADVANTLKLAASYVQSGASNKTKETRINLARTWSFSSLKSQYAQVFDSFDLNKIKS